MKSLIDLYSLHQGKVTDKWERYFKAYEEHFSVFRDRHIRLLEIGVQNGGSLEIWSKYFSEGKVFIGCDIDEKCSQLKHEDPRISVITGDVNTDISESKILTISSKFDLIIDDGSHRSGDVVSSFARYFKHLVNGGIYVVEDLHCSFWSEYEGGCYHPFSSLSFFKKLIDITNYEHWGSDISRTQYLDGFARRYNISFDESVLLCINSIMITNSLCVIKKSAPENNCLGKRVVSGTEEAVSVDLFKLNDTESITPRQIGPWSAKGLPIEIMYSRSIISMRNLQSRFKSLHQRSLEAQKIKKQLEKELADRDDKISELLQDLVQRDEQITRLNEGLAERENTISAIYSAEAWRITLPLRMLITHVKRIVRFLRLVAPAVNHGGGIVNTFHKALHIFRFQGISGFKQVLRVLESSHSRSLIKDEKFTTILSKAFNKKAESVLTPGILIVAEMSIPQCKKYRVDQKCDMIESLGFRCTTVNWHDTSICIDALQTHSVVIFYRVPAFSNVLEIIQEARRLKISTIWEVDDLIFEESILARSRTLAALDKRTFDELLKGAVLYKKAMLLCDKGIASTQGLAVAMRQAGLQEVFTVENALDYQTLENADRINRDQRKNEDKIVRIVYGSGTNTHNVDFLEASGAIYNVLKRFRTVRLRIIGLIELPKQLSLFGERIERQPLCTYEEYLKSLAECDINIAPLENYVFNDSKSNIKYIEGSIVKIASICSPRYSFSNVIKNGINGYLANKKNDWERYLTMLIEDEDLRKGIGNRAYEYVMEHYTPDKIAKSQLSPIFKSLKRKKDRVCLLSVNCYYAPRSFGGATIVAEEINKRLNENYRYDVHVFTTLSQSSVPSYSMRRYDAGGINVFGIALPDHLDEKDQFENVNIQKSFSDVLSSVKPDIVHFHSIQGIGVCAVDICRERNIKHVITLHDTWWLCGRHFMINNQGKYCNQKKIDLNICAGCVENNDLNQYRSKRLMKALRYADMLLAPSRFMAELFIANGLDNVHVNKNGIVKPSVRSHHRKEKIRFGYVGGNTKIKGFHLIKNAFFGLDNYKLQVIIVDNTLNLGFTSFDSSDVESIPNVELVAAYTQDTIDEFFSKIDVLLFPTQWKESFGLTVREALARNVWVIATDAGGVAEDIIDGKNGFIVPFWDDGEELKKAVMQTLKIFEHFKVGEEIILSSSQITYFEDQVAELSNYFERLSNDHEN